MKFTDKQKEVVEAMKKGAKLYASYPMPGVNIDSRIELNGIITLINVSTFKSMLKRKIIGNRKLRTNRHYEYFLTQDE